MCTCRAVLSSDKPVIIDFYADFCGPCKLVEPTLKRLADSDDVKVVKAKLDETPKLQAWIRSHKLKVSFLPTLVLVRNGKPESSIFGAKQIMNPETLTSFANGELGVSEKAKGPANPAEELLTMGRNLFGFA